MCLVAMLCGNVVKANFIQFNNDFVGLNVENEMLLWSIFKSFIQNISVQAWIKSFHICRHGRRKDFFQGEPISGYFQGQPKIFFQKGGQKW